MNLYSVYFFVAQEKNDDISPETVEFWDVVMKGINKLLNSEIFIKLYGFKIRSKILKLIKNQNYMNKFNGSFLKYIMHIFFLLISFSASGQQWTNIGNVEYFDPGSMGYYEVLNEYSENNIPQFDENITWNNHNESIYYFEVNNRSRMWKYSIEKKQWKCIYDKESIELHSEGIGIESINNNPGIRRNSAAKWVDVDGNLWLFSGSELSDLWKYNIISNQWTHVNGSIENGLGVYSDKGTPSPTAHPAARYQNGVTAISFLDNNNDLVMFRGGKSNDLWKYNTKNNLWTWIAGSNPDDVSNDVNEFISSDGTEPEKNTPKSRSLYNSFMWSNESNDYFLLEHTKYSIYQVWKFDQTVGYWFSIKKQIGFPNHDIFGIEDETTEAEVLTLSSYWFHKNNLYIFGGREPNAGVSFSNVFYRFNLDNFQWTWLKGLTKIDKIKGTVSKPIPLYYNFGFVYGDGSAHQLNLPPTRMNGITWVEGDKLYLGYGKNQRKLFDIWSFDLESNNFELLDKSRGTLFDGANSILYKYEYQYNNINQSIYYPKPTTSTDLEVINIEDKLLCFSRITGVTSTNIKTNITKLLKPRQPAFQGEIGVEDERVFPSDFFKVLGTFDNKVYLIDFVKHSMYTFNLLTNNFTCIKKLNDAGVTELLDFNENNFPSNRYGYVSWTSDEGKIYFYSGTVNLNASFPNRRTDLWAYDIATNQWAWLSGHIYNKANDNNNYPPGRTRFNYWIDKDNNLWIFGGYKETNTAFHAHYHKTDMWKYDIKLNEWEMIKLGTGINSPGVYGTQNKFSLFNMPGARSRYSSFVDKNNKFWLVNGYSLRKQDGDLTGFDDIWMFDPILKQWVWIDGLEKEVNVKDQYFNFYGNKKPAARIGWLSFKSHHAFSFTFEDDGYIYENHYGSLWKINTSELTPDYNIFGGTAIYDANVDGCDSLDNPFVNLKIVVDDYNAYTFTDSAGQYSKFCNKISYDINPSYHVDYFNFEPNFVTLDFEGFGKYKNIDFCVSPKGNFNDLTLALIPNRDPNPNFISNYQIQYRNDGTTTLSGEVSLIYDTDRIKFISAIPDTSSSASINPSPDLDTLIWVFEDLKPFESQIINIKMSVTNTNMIGDSIKTLARIESGTMDETPENNKFELNEMVKDAFDSNDKTISEGSLLPIDKIGDYVHYLIRFENTGTANANFIVLRDFIDEDLFDLTSVVPVASSHNYELKLNEEKIMQVYFKNINLPFNESEENKGYFLFKIKSNKGLKGGDKLLNTANIYFDYNEPIITNESESMFKIVLSTEQNKSTKRKLYPNPASQYFLFDTKNVVKAEIINNTGIVRPLRLDSSYIELNNIPNGNYYVKLYFRDGTTSFQHLIIIDKK